MLNKRGGIFTHVLNFKKYFFPDFDKAGKLPQKLTFGENCEQMRMETG